MLNTRLQEIINELDVIAGELSLQVHPTTQIIDGHRLNVPPMGIEGLTTEKLTKWYDVLHEMIDTLEDTKE